MKLLIQRAADGGTHHDRFHPQRRSRRRTTIENRALLVLTARETEAFADAILNPASPRSVPGDAAAGTAKDCQAVTRAG